MRVIPSSCKTIHQSNGRMEYNSDRRFGHDDSAQNINILSFKIYNEMMWNRRWATPFLVIQTVRFSRYFDSIRFFYLFFLFCVCRLQFWHGIDPLRRIKVPPKKLFWYFLISRQVSRASDAGLLGGSPAAPLTHKPKGSEWLAKDVYELEAIFLICMYIYYTYNRISFFFFTSPKSKWATSSITSAMQKL